jgi:hypothetical protein
MLEPVLKLRRYKDKLEPNVAETPVFWLGGKPGANKNKERERPAAERYEPALRDACSACGYDVDEYVAAQGGFGGWLANLERGGQRYRVFWSGKDRQLRFERALPQGGWTELSCVEPADDGLPAFIDSVKAVLQDQHNKA